MKARTKIAIFVLALFLSLVGVNLIANGIMREGFVAAHELGTQVTVEVSNVHILA
jgi:hypothetical protein